MTDKISLSFNFRSKMSNWHVSNVDVAIFVKNYRQYIKFRWSFTRKPQADRHINVETTCFRSFTGLGQVCEMILNFIKSFISFCSHDIPVQILLFCSENQTISYSNMNLFIICGKVETWKALAMKLNLFENATELVENLLMM